MTDTPFYYLVFFDAKNKPMQKKVEQPLYKSLAQNDVITEIELAGVKHIITTRRTFNIHNSFTADYFLIMDIIIKPE